MIVFVVFLNGQTTTWNGTSWSNGVPSANVDAVIAGNYSAYKNIIVKNFTVNAGFTYSIDEGGRLVVHGNVLNNGVIVVKNDAVMVQVNNTSTYAGSGTMTVDRVAKLKRRDFNLWSSPVSGQNVYNFSQGTPRNTIYVYDEATDYYVTTGLNSTSVFQPGIGYSIKGKSAYSTTVPTIETFTFTGVPNNGDITVSLKKSTGLDKGYNLIGNPYPSNLNFRLLWSEANRNSIFNKQLFWTNLNGPMLQQGSNYAGNNYATFVANVGGVGPTYVSNSVEEVSLRPTERTKVGQGFLVQAKYNNAPLTFRNSMRQLIATGSTFYNKTELQDNNDEDENEDDEPEEEIIDRYWLKFVNPDNIANNILIAHISEATDNYDEDYDSALFGLGDDAFYSAVGVNKLQIQARALPIKDSEVIKLGYKSSKAGNCIIALTDKDGVFKNASKAIYLKDNQTETVTNLQNEYYSFANDVVGTENETRFSLLYENNVLATNNIKAQEVSVYKQNNELVAKSNVNISNVQVFDVSGRMIKNAVGNNTKEIRINTDALNKGVYILKITTVKGITTKKVII